MPLYHQRGTGLNTWHDDLRTHTTNGYRFPEHAFAGRLAYANLRIRAGPHRRRVIHGRWPNCSRCDAGGVVLWI